MCFDVKNLQRGKIYTTGYSEYKIVCYLSKNALWKGIVAHLFARLNLHSTYSSIPSTPSTLLTILQTAKVKSKLVYAYCYLFLCSLLFDYGVPWLVASHLTLFCLLYCILSLSCVLVLSIVSCNCIVYCIIYCIVYCIYLQSLLVIKTYFSNQNRFS